MVYALLLFVVISPYTEPLIVDCHLRVVRAAAWGVGAKWRLLGMQLGIEVGTLDVSVVHAVCTLNCSSTRCLLTSEIKENAVPLIIIMYCIAGK